MPATIESLGIDKLSCDEKIVLAHDIWKSLAAERLKLPLSEAKIAELRRRSAEDDAFPDDTVSWEEVEARILARLAKK